MRKLIYIEEMKRLLRDFWTSALSEQCGVFEIAGGDPAENGIAVSSLVYDSRQAGEGSLYFALPGLHADGHEFINNAIDKGARVIVHESAVFDKRDDLCYIRVRNSRAAMPSIAAAFYGHPSRRLKVVGVTGTEGKSTTVYLIFQLLRALGKKAGFISTVQFSLDGTEHWNPEHQTTPEAPVIEERLSAMVEKGCEYAVVESSSHGLSPKTGRLSGIRFEAGVMTCVTHEHLEFHGTLEQYRDDKANLFRQAEGFCVVNIDDPNAAFFIEAAKSPVKTFSAKGAPADIIINDIESFKNGNRYKARGGGASLSTILIEDNLPGAFNTGNVAAALLVVNGLTGASFESLASLVKTLKPVRGRMTTIEKGQDFEVLVDFAHTPSSFETIFPPLRARLDREGAGKPHARIITVFGSAGERDTRKRALQGEIAAKWADIIILADEDPRGEEPLSILREIAAGVTIVPGKTWREGENLFLIPNRPQAIAKAVSLAKRGDLVLLLGKGHENSIIYRDHAEPYDEIACAQSALEELLNRK